MRLIPDWRGAWRLWSVRLNAIGIVLLVAEQALPLWNAVTPEARSALPRSLSIGLPLAFFILALISRVIRQDKIKGRNVHG